MRRTSLILLALLACPLSADAAIAVVSGQITSGFGNDSTFTFPGNTTGGNHVLVAATLQDESNTALIDNIGGAEVTLHGPTDHSTANIRLYIWCYDADGDDDFTVTTSGTAVARVVAVEISGGSCTESGTSATGEGTLMSHLATVITSTSGAFAIAIVQSSSAADYSGTSNPIPTDGSEINTVAQGGYAICGAAGACVVTWSSAANETTLFGIAAVEEGAAATSRTGTLLFGGMGR